MEPESQEEELVLSGKVSDNKWKEDREHEDQCG